MENSNQGLPGGAWIAITTISVTTLLVLIGFAVRLYRSTARLERNIADKLDDESNVEGDLPGRRAIPLLTLSDKFGLKGMFSLFIPVPLVIASLGFLSSFWVMSTEPKNVILQTWLLGNKLPTIVTVTSLILRSGVLGQTALGVSMIASLALEGFLARTQDVPTLMAQRSDKAASFDLLLLFLKRMLGPSYQRPTWLLVPLLLLMATSLGLQFTSTLLLLDLGDGSVPSAPTTTSISLGYISSLTTQHRRIGNDVNYAGSPPRAYPPFAELASDTPRSYEALDYTGISLRAFLPFASQAALMSVREFSGFATLINTTTLCVRPPIQNVTFHHISDPNSFLLDITLDVPTFEQQLNENGFDADDFFEDRFNESKNANQYSPSSPSPGVDGNISCIIAPCSLSNENSNATENDYNGCKDYPIHMCSFGGVRAFAFILETPNRIEEMNVTKWWQIIESSPIAIRKENMWTVMNHTSSIEFKVSLCSTILEPQYKTVNISSVSPLAERTLAIDDTTRTPDPTNLLQWLGVSNMSSSLAERGVFDLKESGWLWRKGGQPGLSGLVARPLSGNPMGQFYKDRSTTYRLCFICSSNAVDGLAYLHPVHTALLRQSLDVSGPAKALQAFWTLVYQSYYYDTMQFFDYFDNGTYNSWTTVLVPVQCGGFVVVCCMAVTHLLLVCGIAVVFLRQTRFSKLHDPWLAYTQAWNGDFADVLDEVKRRGIADPSRFLERRNRGEEMVGLELDVLERDIGIRKRREKLLDESTSSDSSDSGRSSDA